MSGVARVGAYGCRGFACGRVSRWFWTVPQEMGADFAIGPGPLGGFRQGLFAAGSVDLGQRWHVVAFRADSACETAKKFADGVRVG